MKQVLTNLALLLMLITLVFMSKPLAADDTNTQTNTSGSNTNITGGYESTSETTYADGSTNTTTTNNDSTSTTNNKTSSNGPANTHTAHILRHAGVTW